MNRRGCYPWSVIFRSWAWSVTINKLPLCIACLSFLSFLVLKAPMDSRASPHLWLVRKCRPRNYLTIEEPHFERRVAVRVGEEESGSAE